MGGVGYTRSCPVEKYFRDAKIGKAAADVHSPRCRRRCAGRSGSVPACAGLPLLWLGFPPLPSKTGFIGSFKSIKLPF